MLPFSKIELRVTAMILVIIFLVTWQNLKISERKSRDVQRRDDLARIYEALHRFHGDFGFFPPSDSGKIMACKGQNFDKALIEAQVKNLDVKTIYAQNLAACEWGQDSFRNLTDLNLLPYLPTIHKDTYDNRGFSYYYSSNLRYFQLYAALEGGSGEVGYSEAIVKRQLPCGEKACNFGRSAFGKTPLDMTLEEYEKRLEENPKFNTELEKRRVN